MEKSKIYQINKFKGLNVSADESQIEDNESPDMLNFELDIEGALKKRYGFEKVFESLGDSPINGIYTFTKNDFTSIEILAHGTKLYELKDNVPTVIYDGLANNKVKFFTMKNKCYILDGEHYLEFDGETVKTPEPYVPELFRNGEAIEDFNLLGNRFKCVFSPDGTKKEFYLGIKGLDDTEIKVSTDGGTTWLTTGFTVDKTEGKITMTTAPADGEGTLWIEAGKTDSTKPKMIQNCTLRIFGGGSNDTRILLSGNNNFPNRVFRSGLYDPTYYPENGFTDIGSDNERIMNFCKQYENIVVIKEKSIYAMTYNLDKLLYQTKPLHEQSGAVSGGSIQVINNCPVWLDRYRGLMQLKQTNIQDERNVSCISEKINPMLLKEPNLENSISVEYSGRYYLVLNGKAYVFDYIKNIWYLFNNINATCFKIKNTLFFGDTKGCLQRFKNEEDPFPYNDNGELITAYWYSKLLNFGADYREKTIKKMYYAMKPDDRTSIKVYYVTETTEEKLLVTERLDLQNLDIFYFDPFSFIGNSLPLSDGIKSKIKKVVYFKCKIENNTIDESLTLLSLSFEVQPTRFRK